MRWHGISPGWHCCHYQNLSFQPNNCTVLPTLVFLAWLVLWYRHDFHGWTMFPTHPTRILAGILVPRCWLARQPGDLCKDGLGWHCGQRPRLSHVNVAAGGIRGLLSTRRGAFECPTLCITITLCCTLCTTQYSGLCINSYAFVS